MGQKRNPVLQVSIEPLQHNASYSDSVEPVQEDNMIISIKNHQEIQENQQSCTSSVIPLELNLQKGS